MLMSQAILEINNVSRRVRASGAEITPGDFGAI